MTKKTDLNITELTAEVRAAGFNSDVEKASKKWFIGINPKGILKEDGTIGAIAHLTDTLPKDEPVK